MNELEFRLILTADNRRLIRGVRGASESIDITSASAEELEAAIRAAMTADQSDLVRRIDDVDSSLESSAESAMAMGSALTAALTGGTAAAIVALVRSTSSAAKEMRNMANVANEGYEEFQAYAFATESVGIEADQLADISKDLQDKLGDFVANEGGDFVDFFGNVGNKVGLTVDQLQGLSGPDALIAVSNALDTANVSAEEQVFYMEAMGSEASLLLPLLKDNGAQLHAMAAEGRALGAVLSDIESESLFEAAKASKRLDTAIDGVSKRVAIKFAPAVASVSNLIADLVASGALESYLTSLSARFDVFAEDAAATLDIVTQFIDTSLKEWGSDADEASNFFGDAFGNLPENARALIQLMVVELASMVDYGSSYGKAFAQSLGVELAALVDKAGIYGQELADNLNPFDGDSFDLEAELARSNATATDMIDGFYEQAEASAEITRQARLASIKSILDENTAAVESFDDQSSAAVTLLDDYRRLKAAREASIAAGNGSANDGSFTSPEPETATERRERELLEAEGFRSAEEKAEADHQARLAQIRAGLLGEFTAVNDDSATSEIARLNDEYDQRLEVIRDRFGEGSDLEVELTKNKNDRIAELEQTALSARLQQSSDFFGNLAQISAAANGKQSKLFKTAAIAQATIKTYEGATSAYASLAPIPIVGHGLGIAAAGAAITAGMANVQAIASQDVSGIAHGGMTNVPAESTYLLQKGERVLSPGQNADFTNFINQVRADQPAAGAAAANVVVNVYEDAERAGSVERSTDASGQDVIDVFVANYRAGGEMRDILDGNYQRVA